MLKGALTSSVITVTEEQEKEGTGLSSQDKQMLYFIKEGYNYHEIAGKLRLKTGEAYRRGSEARRHFAELHHIPLETLHLDKYKNHPGRGPHINNTERELLDAFLRKEMVQLPPDFTNQLLVRMGLPPLQPGELEALRAEASNPQSPWKQRIEQRRQESQEHQR